MASMMSSCKSTMAVAALLVLVACASSSVGAQQPTSSVSLLSVSVVDVTFVNQLTESTLTVTIGALSVIGSPDSVTLAPGATGSLAVDVAAVLLDRDILKFQVNDTLYVDTASGPSGLLGRLVAEAGVLEVVVSAGPCASGQDGLTLMDYAAGVLINNANCAVRQS